MNFKILSIGKFQKDCPFLKLFHQYTKRIRCNVILSEFKNEEDKTKSYNLQKSLIEKNISNEKEIIILDKKGKNLSSKELSVYFQEKMNKSCKEIIFIIGGPEGIDKNLIKSFFNLSFGNQTWPHLLVRVMLVEQIYRSLSILQGHPYHK